ncbi:beta-ketoacyl-[acyl-carrier-protein] synthase family protein [Noviherbaspirillum sp.]|jgi:3-oxoacyl-[acyl-carrier-protein] synthase II|uniref:beta-ketoacyl-[acyl-carrier-protein] synthase family protein n=1 Tax=Noviherbaspirillum sp. TaxID=1926288 RepID=UPI0025E597F2|nr:beta-ketoacyl-[acyl-carrier-protein] synthase family protein [Noviherbaspirillum sp.]
MLARQGRRVAVTGIGLMTCVGETPNTFFQNLMDGVSGIRRSARLPEMHKVGGVEFDSSRHFSKIQLLSLDRVSQMAMVVSDRALDAARLKPEDTSRCGVFLGTGMGGAESLENAYWNFFKAEQKKRLLTVPLAMNHAPASQIAMRHGIHGECQTFSAACSSSSIAIGDAYRRIKDGYLDTVLAGGAECMLTPGVINEWQTLQVLATSQGEPSTGCRPFSKGRTGFHIAEGACVVVLEEMEGAIRRGAHILAEIIGYGLSNDASHITKPDEGGQSRAIEAALRDAQVEPQDIDYINAHGTATMVGDVVETRSIKRVFGEHAHAIPVSSTKSSHGHAIGATGAIEFAASVLAMQHRAVPPTAFWQERDPDCDLDYVPGKGRAVDRLMTVMSNSFAFGGNNAVLVARAVE